MATDKPDFSYIKDALNSNSDLNLSALKGEFKGNSSTAGRTLSPEDAERIGVTKSSRTNAGEGIRLPAAFGTKVRMTGQILEKRVFTVPADEENNLPATTYRQWRAALSDGAIGGPTFANQQDAGSKIFLAGARAFNPNTNRWIWGDLGVKFANGSDEPFSWPDKDFDFYKDAINPNTGYQIRSLDFVKTNGTSEQIVPDTVYSSNATGTSFELGKFYYPTEGNFFGGAANPNLIQGNVTGADSFPSVNSGNPLAYCLITSGHGDVPRGNQFRFKIGNCDRGDGLTTVVQTLDITDVSNTEPEDDFLDRLAGALNSTTTAPQVHAVFVDNTGTPVSGGASAANYLMIWTDFAQAGQKLSGENDSQVTRAVVTVTPGIGDLRILATQDSAQFAVSDWQDCRNSTAAQIMGQSYSDTMNKFYAGGIGNNIPFFEYDSANPNEVILYSFWNFEGVTGIFEWRENYAEGSELLLSLEGEPTPAGESESDYFPDDLPLTGVSVAEFFFQDGLNVDRVEIEGGGNYVPIPVGYNVSNATYASSWDGVSFQATQQVVDNPAWNFNGYWSNPKFGVTDTTLLYSDELIPLRKDLWEASKYADESVPDGNNGFHKRFIMNGQVTGDASRIESLKSMAANFHADFVYDRGLPRVVQDRPKPIKRIVNQSMVNAGTVRFTPSSTRGIATRVIVSFFNPDKQWQTDTVEVVDFVRTSSTKEVTKEVFAWGVTDKVRAKRYGRWVMANDNAPVSMAAFSTMRYLWDVELGDYIILDESDYTLNQKPGRVKSMPTATTAVLDRNPGTVSNGMIMWIDHPITGAQKFTVSSWNASTLTVTLVESMSDFGNVISRPYVLASSPYSHRMYRCLKRTITDQGNYDFTFIHTNPAKWSYIDNVNYYNKDFGDPTQDTSYVSWVTAAGGVPSLPDSSTVMDYQFNATGATEYFVVAGKLPTGITLTTAGHLEGTTNAPAGLYQFTVRATNGYHYADRAFFTIVGTLPVWVTPAGSIGTFDETTLSTASVQAFAPGVGNSIVYSVLSGALPSGITLNASSGALEGNFPCMSPPSTFDTYNFTIRATSVNNPASVDRAFSLRVREAGYVCISADNLTQTVDVLEDTPFTITNMTVGSDEDVGVFTLTMSMSDATAGVLSAPNSAGATSTFISGVLTITGSAAGVQAILTSGVTITPAANRDTDWYISNVLTHSLGSTRTGVTTVNMIAVNDPPVWITPSGSLGSVLEGHAISVQLEATDIDAGDTLTYSVNPGSSLPSGFTLSSTGLLSGQGYVTVDTTYTFTARVTDVAGSFATRVFSFDVLSVPLTWITPAGSLGTYNEGVYWSATLQADGPQPITFSKVGTWKSYIDLASDGSISGRTYNTNESFTVRATAGDGQTADRTFTITSVAQPPVWNTPPAGSQGSYLEGTTYSYDYVASGIDPITYSIVSGSLPPGLTMNTTTPARITGTFGIVNADTTYTYTIRATNTTGSYTDRTFSITVQDYPFHWDSTQSSTIIAYEGTDPQSIQLRYIGGTPPVTVSLVSGSLPSGWGLSSAGYLTGNIGHISADSSFTFTARISDVKGALYEEDKTFTIQVKQIQAPTWVTPAGSLQSGIRNFYDVLNIQLQANKGSNTIVPNHFSIASGSLPPGITMSDSGLISGMVNTEILTATTYTFTVNLYNDDFTVPRTFSLSVLKGTKPHPIVIDTAGNYDPSQVGSTILMEAVVASSPVVLDGDGKWRLSMAPGFDLNSRTNAGSAPGNVGYGANLIYFSPTEFTINQDWLPVSNITISGVSGLTCQGYDTDNGKAWFIWPTSAVTTGTTQTLTVTVTNPVGTTTTNLDVYFIPPVLDQAMFTKTLSPLPFDAWVFNSTTSRTVTMSVGDNTNYYVSSRLVSWGEAVRASGQVTYSFVGTPPSWITLTNTSHGLGPWNFVSSLQQAHPQSADNVVLNIAPPESAANSTVNFTLRATYGSLTSDQTFSVNVNAVAAYGGIASASAGSSYSFNASADGQTFTTVGSSLTNWNRAIPVSYDGLFYRSGTRKYNTTSLVLDSPGTTGTVTAQTVFNNKYILIGASNVYIKDLTTDVWNTYSTTPFVANHSASTSNWTHGLVKYEPTSGNLIYIYSPNTGGTQLYCRTSTDGITWSSPIAIHTVNEAVGDLTMHVVGSDVYVISNAWGTGSTVYGTIWKSSNGGASWSVVGNVCSNMSSVLASAPENYHNLFSSLILYNPVTSKWYRYCFKSSATADYRLISSSDLVTWTNEISSATSLGITNNRPGFAYTTVASCPNKMILRGLTGSWLFDGSSWSSISHGTLAYPTILGRE